MVESSCRAEEALAAKLPAELTRTADRIRAGAWATLWTAVLVAAIVLGSRNLQNFDPALVIYTFAIIFATWGVIYHYTVWIRKPPTYVYWRRGWQLFKERGVLRSFGQIVAAGGNTHPCPNIHCETFATALGHASVDFLGMPAGGGDHLPAGLRLDQLHQRAHRSDDVRHSPVRLSTRSASVYIRSLP